MLFLSFLGFGIFSIAYNMLGPLVPNIMETTGITLPQAGSLLSAQQGGALLSILLILFIQSRVRMSTMIRLGYAAIITAFSLISIFRSTEMLFLAYIILGFGSFLIDSGTNSYIAYEYFNRRGSYISLLHFSYGGAALLTGYIVLPFKNPSWPFAYTLVAALLLIILLLSFHADSRGDRKKQKGSDQRQDPITPLLKDIPFLLYTLVIFLYMGSQISCSAWIPVYVETELGAKGVVVASSLMMFWVGTSLSRLLASIILSRGGKPFLLSIWGMALAGLSLIVATGGTQNLAIVLTFTALTGFFAGSTIPMYIVVASTWYPRNTTFISLSYILSGTLGRMIIPVGITLLADRTSLAFGLKGSSSLLFLSAVLIWLVQRMTKDRPSEVA